jgi:hypothetical protein
MVWLMVVDKSGGYTGGGLVAKLKKLNVCAGLVIVAPAQPPDQGWSESNSPGDVENPRELQT